MKQHIIFTLGRSGSNYLVTLFNKHPQITNYGEVLGEWTLPYKLHKRLGLGGNSTGEYLEYLYTSRAFFGAAQLYSMIAHVKKREPINFKLRQQIKTLGIKEFSTNFKRRKLKNFLQEHGNILVINLFRENILKRLISLEKMWQSGIVAVQKRDRSVSQQQKKIYLEPSQLTESLAVFQEEIDEHFRIVNRLPQERVLNISYENLFASTQSLDKYKDQIYEFLEVSSNDLTGVHQKILPDDLSKIVANYEEVREVLLPTPYAKYLD